MYKIDDITKFNLSDKKQYAIAKETLDRYELTQSEKKGLLEGIKNRGGGSDGNYRYFRLGPYYLSNDLIKIATEAIGSNQFYWGECRFPNDMNKGGVHLCTTFNEYGNLERARASAIKIDIDGYTMCDINNTGFAEQIKISDYLIKLLYDYGLENFEGIEITKEEYEGNVNLPKHLIYTADAYDTRFVDENNRQENIEKLFNSLCEIHNNNLDINDYFYYICDALSTDAIIKIDSVYNKHIDVTCLGNKYYRINIEDKTISEIE